MSSDEKSGPVRRRRAIERPRIPSGRLADLKALLYEFYVQAGTPTLDEIAAPLPLFFPADCLTPSVNFAHEVRCPC